MNVLSLFDGMSGGQIALNRLGIKVDNYYASEIDKYAIKTAKKNYPDTQHLGSVVNLTEEQLLELGDIDLLIGGSPCQGFSFAGKKKGSSTKCGVDVTTLEQYLDLKNKGFEFDGQSYLFWEYVRIWKIVKPKYFLLENVRITKKWQKMFDGAMGVKPLVINSSLLSAQSRVRYYWTNIEGVEQPEDKNISLEDIVDKDALISISDWNKYLSLGIPNEPLKREKFAIMLSNIYGGFKEKKPRAHLSKSVTVRTSSGGGTVPSLLIDNNDKFVVDDFRKFIRTITPTECELLQTVPKNYTDGVSNTQRYKMLGNGFTVDIICHILSGLKKGKNK
jgi:DNA-cytosine methyltransferase